MNEEMPNPCLLSYLRRQNNKGKIILFIAWFLSVGSLFVFGDEIYSAVIALCIAVAGWFVGGYYIARSFLIVKRPGIYRIFISLILIIGVFWFWYYVWDHDFLSRDYDAGTVKMILGLPFLFFPLLDIFIRYNYQRGIYHRILERFN